MLARRFPAFDALEYFLLAYRRTWRASVATTFVNPVLYLLAMGVGLGSFVNKGAHTSAIGHMSYLQFVAPALAATAAAMTATSESMYPVMAGFKWIKTYHSMLATPLRVADVLAAHLSWIAARIAMAVTAYLIVMAAFGTTRSPWAVGILPVGVLTGMAFAAPLAAFTVTQDSENAFPLIFRLGLIPLFLFSGVFFPIGQLPFGLRLVAYLTPLWHGVDLSRTLALGHGSLGSAAFDLAYLVGVGALGVWVASKTFPRRLVT
jgi:lipooligosaccharide transport system permease protein